MSAFDDERAWAEHCRAMREHDELHTADDYGTASMWDELARHEAWEAAKQAACMHPRTYQDTEGDYPDYAVQVFCAECGAALGYEFG